MLKNKKLITGEELSLDKINVLLEKASFFKKQNKQNNNLSEDLKGKTLALLYDKPSMQSRFSFSTSMYELGGHTVISQLILRKNELVRDKIRMLANFCHALVIQSNKVHIMKEIEEYSIIPIINEQSDKYRPCQALSDLFTIKEYFQNLKKVPFTYIGCGNTMLHSLLLILPYYGLDFRFSCPKNYGPHAFVLKRAIERAKIGGGAINHYDCPEEAAKGSLIIYTDEWFEDEKEKNSISLDDLKKFQVNEQLFKKASQDAILMHSLPITRNKEIASDMIEKPCSLIFTQSANNLFIQKAILTSLLT